MAFLRAEHFAFRDAELAAQRPLFERALRREVARRQGGDAAAARVAFENDPVFRRALEVLRRARVAREVFALGPTGAAAPPARRAATPRAAAGHP